MRSGIAIKPTQLLALLFGAWALLNILTASFTELSSDEAYYWFVSRSLDWGYFDHPPLFALFANIGTAFLGNTELGMRFCTAVALPLALFLFWFVVRGEKCSLSNAWVYFLACFSVPILHLYGFVATPDTPLIFAATLTIVALKLYLNNNRWGFILLGLGFAMMAYAKYHGVIVVIMIIASRPKMLLDWRFYAACAIAAVLFAPHLYWQWSHDWVSFKYHLVERQAIFSWGAVWEYLGNFIGTFNPLLVFPFMVLMFKKPKLQSEMGRTMKFIFWGFFIFFLLSTSRGHVQPQWIIVAVLPVIFVVTRASFTARGLAKYIRNTSMVLGGLLLGVHVFAMVNDKALFANADIFETRKPIEESQTEFEGVDLIITNGSYQLASKLNFYGSTPAYAMPNIRTRSSQYQFVDMDSRMYGHRVAQQVGIVEYFSAPIDSLKEKHKVVAMPYDNYLVYDVIESYVPSRKVKICIENFPAKVLTDSRLALLLNIYNPYDFDIKLGGADGFDIVMMIGRNEEFVDVRLPFKEQVLGAKSKIIIATTAIIPIVPTAEFKVGITLRKEPYDSWYNSEVYTLGIINPKTKI